MTGRGNVLEITFRAEELGVTKLRFLEGKALDSDLKPVRPVKTRGTQVRVVSPKPGVNPEIEMRSDVPLIRTLEGLDAGL